MQGPLPAESEEKKSELFKTCKRNLANTYREKEENLANTYHEKEENLAKIYQKPMKNVLPISLILYKTTLARNYPTNYHLNVSNIYKKEANNDKKKHELPTNLALNENDLARHDILNCQNEENGKKNEIITHDIYKNNQISINLHIYKLSIYSKLFTFIVNYQFKFQFQFNSNQFNYYYLHIIYNIVNYNYYYIQNFKQYLPSYKKKDYQTEKKKQNKRREEKTHILIKLPDQKRYIKQYNNGENLCELYANNYMVTPLSEINKPIIILILIVLCLPKLIRQKETIISNDRISKIDISRKGNNDRNLLGGRVKSALGVLRGQQHGQSRPRVKRHPRYEPQHPRRLEAVHPQHHRIVNHRRSPKKSLSL